MVEVTLLFWLMSHKPRPLSMSFPDNPLDHLSVSLPFFFTHFEMKMTQHLFWQLNHIKFSNFNTTQYCWWMKKSVHSLPFTICFIFWLTQFLHHQFYLIIRTTTCLRIRIGNHGFFFSFLFLVNTFWELWIWLSFCTSVVMSFSFLTILNRRVDVSHLRFKLVMSKVNIFLERESVFFMKYIGRGND